MRRLRAYPAPGYKVGATKEHNMTTNDLMATLTARPLHTIDWGAMTPAQLDAVASAPRRRTNLYTATDAERAADSRWNAVMRAAGAAKYTRDCHRLGWL